MLWAIFGGILLSLLVATLVWALITAGGFLAAAGFAIILAMALVIMLRPR